MSPFPIRMEIIMTNKDFVVRLKKTDRDGGDFLDWVVYPKNNALVRPAVIERFDPGKAYHAGTFVTKDGEILKAKANVPARFVPVYKQPGSVVPPIDVDLAPTINGQTGVVSEFYTMPKDAELEVEISLDAVSSSASVTAATVQLRNTTQALVLDTIDFNGLSTNTTTALYTGTIDAITGDALGIAIDQTADAHVWEVTADNGGMDGSVANVLFSYAGQLFAAFNTEQKIMHRAVDGTWTDLWTGTGLPTWSNITAIGYDVVNNTMYIACTDKVFAKDLTADSWQDVTFGITHTDIQHIAAHDGLIVSQDAVTGQVDAYAGSWGRVDDLTGGGSLVGLFVRNDKICSVRTTDDRIVELNPSEWTAAADSISNYSASSIVINYDSVSEKLTWLDMTDGNAYFKEDTGSVEAFDPQPTSNSVAVASDVFYASTATGLQTYNDSFAVELSNFTVKLKEVVVVDPNDPSIPGPDTFVESEWENAGGYEAYIMPHSENINYTGDSVIYDADGQLWYLEEPAAKGPFASQAWRKVSPEDMIDSAVSYLDPNSKTERPTVVVGGFVELDSGESQIKALSASFYDTSDIYSLRQDVSGGVPVTRPGQPVRMIYDQLGTNHIVINNAIPPTYQVDENGRGYLLHEDGNNILIQENGNLTDYTMLSVIAGVGVVRADNVNKDTGIPVKTSDKAKTPITQFVLVEGGTAEADIDAVVAELNKLSLYMAPGLVTSLKDLFRDSIVNWRFVTTPVMRFITDISGMYAGTAVNDSLDIFDVSKVKTMREVFRGTTTPVDVTSWNTVSATDISYMFAGDVDVTGVETLTVTNVAKAVGLFENNTLFNTDLSTFDAPNLTDVTNMFAGATAFNQSINFLTGTKLTTLNGLLKGATSFNQTVYLTLDDLTSAFETFSYCDAMTSDVTINASRLDSFQAVFKASVAYNGRLQLNTQVLENITELFFGCEVLNAPVLVNLSKVKYADRAFALCAAFNQPLNLTASIIESADMAFYDCTDLATYPFDNMNFMELRNGKALFRKCASMATEIDLFAPFLADMSSFFENCISITGAVKIRANNTTSMSTVLEGCSGVVGPLEIETLNATDFTLACADMTSLAADVTINAPKATNATSMFEGCTAFNHNLSFTTDYVTAFDSFLSGATAFNQSLAHLDFSSIRTGYRMFADASSFDQPIGYLPFNDMTALGAMLMNATAYSQDLSGICVSAHPAEPVDFLKGTVTEGDVALHPKWGEACV